MRITINLELQEYINPLRKDLTPERAVEVATFYDCLEDLTRFADDLTAMIKQEKETSEPAAEQASLL